MTKDYPGAEASRLDRSDTFRVNVRAGGAAVAERAAADVDPGSVDTASVDTVLVHPVYGRAG